LGIPDESLSVWLDVEQWRETKDRSWAMHRTQMNPNNPLSQIPEDVQKKWREREYFQLAASRVGPDVPGENDLFARVQALS
jgi:N-acetyl-1-D-myo-inositol-2-amino-2-deoxy-alpha-D-glucopyranoside deacetylase